MFSNLNHLEDITFHRGFSTLTGYTQEELEHNFVDYLRVAEQDLELSPKALLDQIKYWYNGYTWDLKHYVYNPVSFMKFCSQRKFSNHWFATGTPGFLIQQIKSRSEFNLEHFEVNERAFESYVLQNLDLPILLFQTGYLTLQSKKAGNVYHLGYPNHEVREAITDHLMAAYGNLPLTTPGPTVWKLREAFFKNDLELAISILNTLFENIPSTLDRKNNEADYQAMLYLVFRYMGMDAEAEVASLRGRSDAVLKTPTHVYVLEFKLDQSAQHALDYLRQKGYAEKYRHDGRPVLLLGINFSRAERCVTAWKVEGL